MRNIIIIAAIAGLSIYVYVNYKDKIKAKFAPLIPGATNPVNGQVTPVTAQDTDVLNLVNQIMNESQDYNTATEYADAKVRLQAAIQPVVINCLVAPCPQPDGVSPKVLERVNFIIGMLDIEAAELAKTSAAESFFV